jgi:hypothetical protein
MRYALRGKCAVVSAVLLAAGGLVKGDLVAYLPAAQDATLLGGTDAAANRSLADPGLFAGVDGAGNPRRGLIEFNIGAKIPAGSTITGVTLQMDLGQAAGSGGGVGGGTGGSQTISLFDESQAWGQPTNVAGASSFSAIGHGGSAATGDATWNDAFFNTTPWTTAGGDYSSSLSDRGDATVGATLTTYPWSAAGMTADVQNWLNNPATNFGWLIRNSDETSLADFRAFWSAQGAAAYLAANPTNPANISAPELIVTYQPVPEPFSLLTFSSAALLPLMRRRRRS